MKYTSISSTVISLLSFGKINPVCLIYLYKKRGHFYFERIVIIYILSFLVFFDEEKIERSFSKRIYRNIVTVYNRKLSKKKEENKQPSLWNKIHKWQWEHHVIIMSEKEKNTAAQSKLVQCMKGIIFDVAVNIRKDAS